MEQGGEAFGAALELFLCFQILAEGHEFPFALLKPGGKTGSQFQGAFELLVSFQRSEAVFGGDPEVAHLLDQREAGAAKRFIFDQHKSVDMRSECWKQILLF